MLSPPKNNCPNAPHERAAQVAEALARLPDDMQQVLLERYWNELPFEHIAQRLQRTAGATRVLHLRALRRLAEQLKPVE